MGLDMSLYKTHPSLEASEGEEVAYWRKANQIHRWFVVNVQNGLDECKAHQVSKQQLEELLETCIKVADSRNPTIEIKDDKKFISTANTLLPTQPGFFFGSTDIGEYYLEDINSTIEQLQKILSEFDDNYRYEYCSSW